MKTPDDIFDQLLVLQCQQGDEASLAQLVERWQPRLVRQALRLTGRAEAAADIAQEAWLAIVRSINKLDDPACFRPWAYRIVTNKSADWIRRQQKERAANEKLAIEPHANVSPTTTSNNEINILQQALKQLPRQRQTLLTMFYLDAMSINDIAQALDLPAGTVKSRLFHARNELKSKIERHGNE